MASLNYNVNINHENISYNIGKLHLNNYHSKYAAIITISFYLSNVRFYLKKCYNLLLKAIHIYSAK